MNKTDIKIIYTVMTTSVLRRQLALAVLLFLLVFQAHARIRKGTTIIKNHDSKFEKYSNNKKNDNDGTVNPEDLTDVGAINCEEKTRISDRRFEAYLASRNLDGTGDPADGEVCTDLIRTVRYLDLKGLVIGDLRGIEDFKSLEVLLCHRNELTELDVSQNTALIKLDCSYNQLTSLNVDSNTKLEVLYCVLNDINSLDVSQNTLLKDLDCHENELTELDVSQNTALSILDCSYNKEIDNLEVGTNTMIEVLYCNEVGISNLNLSRNRALRELDFSDSDLTRLNLKNGNNEILSGVRGVGNSRLTCVLVDDLRFFEDKSRFVFDHRVTLTENDEDCHSTVITSSCTETTRILDSRFEAYLASQNLDGTGNPADGMVCTDRIKNLRSLIIPKNSNIMNLIGIEDFKALEELRFPKNEVMSIDLRENIKLKILDCEDNLLPELNLKNNVLLTYLNCIKNNIKNLDLSKNPNLNRLSCRYNLLTELNLTNNVLLTGLGCSGNNIRSLDLSKNIKLEILSCQKNELTALDISNNPALYYLDCSENDITGLNFRLNKNIQTLYCSENKLNRLDIRNGNNGKLSVRNFKNNQLLSCILVDDPNYSNANWSDDKDEFAKYGNIENNCSTGIVSCKETTRIYDLRFEAYLASKDLDGTGDPADGMVCTDRIKNIELLDIRNEGIERLDGIGDFESLKHLFCQGNRLTSLDLTRNTELIKLVCNNNQITSLKVGGSGSLNQLNCENNRIEDLNIENNTKLINLSCSNNQFSSLDLTNSPVLANVLCNNNELLANLDLRNGNNFNLRNVDFKNNPSLNCILVDDAHYSNGNWADKKDASAKYANNSEDCPSTVITSSCTETTRIYDLRFEAYLASKDLDGTGDPADGMVCTDLIKTVRFLNLKGLEIGDLRGIEDFKSLEILFCHRNELTELDVSQNTALVNLNCSYNQLTSLNVDSNTKLEFLYCTVNEINSLDVSKNTLLKDLDCHKNELTELDVSQNTALINLDCSYNKEIDNLEVGTNTMIEVLYCTEVSISNLNLSRNRALKELDFRNSGLTRLNLKNGNNEILSGVRCFENPRLNCVLVDDLRFFEDKSRFVFDHGVTLTENDEDCPSTVITSSCTETTRIYDRRFEAYLASKDLDGTGDPADGMVCTDRIKNLQSLDIEVNDITDLRGIEDFVSLTNLHIIGTKITNLDISKNTKLTSFNSFANLRLTSLDFSKNTDLMELNCSENDLMSLNLKNRNNGKITDIEARKNPRLRCILVDDSDLFSDRNRFIIDNGVRFVENLSQCGSISAPSEVSEVAPANSRRRREIITYYSSRNGGELHLKKRLGEKIKALVVKNVLGKDIYSSDKDLDGYPVSLPDGHYYVKIVTNKGVFTKRIAYSQKR